MKTFQSFVEKLRSYTERPCIERQHCMHTYAQLLDEFATWQRHLDQLDVQRGSVVGIQSECCVHAIAAALAVCDRQAVAALIPRNRKDVDRYLVDSFASTYISMAADGAFECRRLNPSRHPLLDRLLLDGDSGLVMFTSGSAGRPKAALQSTERFLLKFFEQGHSLRTLAFLTFDHVAGQDTIFYTLANGGTLILPERRDPHAILSLIESHRVEVLPVSPSFLRMLCAGDETERFDLSSLKIITYGSEPMDTHTLSKLNARFPSIRIIQKYGTTETGSPRTVSRGNDSLWLKLKPGGFETKIVNGILWIRGDSTILGYLNAESPVDAAGWYCTGDLVEVDGEWIRFLGRATDLINVGGEKVAPAEVEQAILELDYVLDVAVFGTVHPLMGKVVCARVLLQPDMLDRKDAAKGIRAHCRRHLAPYKVPVSINFENEPLAGDRQKVLRHRSALPRSEPNS